MPRRKQDLTASTAVGLIHDALGLVWSCGSGLLFERKTMNTSIGAGNLIRGHLGLSLTSPLHAWKNECNPH